MTTHTAHQDAPTAACAHFLDTMACQKFQSN